MAARAIEPGVGRNPTRFVLRLRPGQEELRARFDTGGKDWDKDLNRRGAVLAALYGLSVLRAEEKPVALNDLVDVAEILAVHGVRARSGPTSGERLGLSDESLLDGLLRLQPILPGLTRAGDETDGRRSTWQLTKGWPNIVVEGPRDWIGDWPSLRHRLWGVVRMARQARKDRAERESAAAKEARAAGG